MISRMVKWRRLPGLPIWRGKIGFYAPRVPVMDLMFEVHAGSRSKFISRNAKLDIKVKQEGQRYHRQVIATKEFTSSWEAKAAVDAVLFMLHLMDKSPEESRQWLLERFDEFPKLDMPEPSPYASVAGYDY